MVGFPLFDHVTLLDFAGATQIFGFAGGFEAVWLASTIAPVMTTEHVQVLPSRTFNDPGPIDVLFVPGGGALGIGQAMFDPDYQGFLKRAAASAEWCGSVCTGAFVLAAARLLDGCRATTYWSQLENLALLSAPMGLEVVTGCPRYVIDGRHRRFTGGGISSSIDLALALVSEMDGVDAARRAQLSSQYAPHPPVTSGDPTHAPPELTAQVRESQADFTAAIRTSVERLISI